MSNNTTFSYIFASLKANVKAGLATGKAAYFSAGFMFIQTMLFMLVWVVFFQYANDLKGWGLREILILNAVGSFSFGLSSFFCGGAYSFSQTINSGQLDNFLCRPGSVLLSVLFSNAMLHGLGDILSGLVLITVAAQLNIMDWVFFISCALPCAVIFGSLVLMFQSIAFWQKNSESLSHSLFEFMIILAHQPHHGFPIVAKILIFTIIPVGFLGLVPVTIISENRADLLVPLYLAALVIALIARFMFYRGLKQYESGNILS